MYYNLLTLFICSSVTYEVRICCRSLRSKTLFYTGNTHGIGIINMIPLRVLCMYYQCICHSFIMSLSWHNDVGIMLCHGFSLYCIGRYVWFYSIYTRLSYVIVIVIGNSVVYHMMLWLTSPLHYHFIPYRSWVVTNDLHDWRSLKLTPSRTLLQLDLLQASGFHMPCLTSIIS